MPVKPLTEMSKIEKFRHYSREQGVVHAGLAGLGRKFPSVWGLFGSRFTQKAYQRYRARTGPAAMMINLGGGSHRIDGAFNVDVDPRADAYVDITKPLPFPAGTFHYIFCEEVLEHVDQANGLVLLAECHRVLQNRGVLRITTPDLGYFARNVMDSDRNGAEINHCFYGHGHRHIYSKGALADAMKRAGFSSVEFSSYRDASSVLGRYDSHATRFDHSPESSLYCEGIRLDDSP